MAEMLMELALDANQSINQTHLVKVGDRGKKKYTQKGIFPLPFERWKEYTKTNCAVINNTLYFAIVYPYKKHILYFAIVNPYTKNHGLSVCNTFLKSVEVIIL